MRFFDRFRRFPVRRQVIVNTKTNRAFKGILFCKKGPLLVLKNATIHESTGTHDVDGEVLIERDNVDFIQVLDGSSSV